MGEIVKDWIEVDIFVKMKINLEKNQFFVVIGSTFQPWSSAQLSWNNIKVW
jgi:hypothetical protein